MAKLLPGRFFKDDHQFEHSVLVAIVTLPPARACTREITEWVLDGHGDETDIRNALTRMRNAGLVTAELTRTYDPALKCSAKYNLWRVTELGKTCLTMEATA